MGDVYRVTPREGGHIEEQLSAYIDGVLNARERDVIRLHMEGCAECRAAHDSLLLTRSLVRSLPQVAPPRAFTLTQEMAAPARRDSFWSRILARRNAPRLATASALSFALVVAMLVGNLLMYDRSSNVFSRIGSAINSEPLSSDPSVPSGAFGQEELSRTAGASETPGAALEPPMRNVQVTAAADAVPTAIMAETPVPEVMAGNAPTPNTTMKAAATPAAVGTGYAPELDGSVTSAETNVASLPIGSDPRGSDAIGEYGSDQFTPSMGPASSRQGAGARDDLTGDGGGIYFALVGLFLALGIALGAGAMVARRMQR
jgi:hypothetical protein